MKYKKKIIYPSKNLSFVALFEQYFTKYNGGIIIFDNEYIYLIIEKKKFRDLGGKRILSDKSTFDTACREFYEESNINEKYLSRELIKKNINFVINTGTSFCDDNYYVFFIYLEDFESKFFNRINNKPNNFVNLKLKYLNCPLNYQICYRVFSEKTNIFPTDVFNLLLLKVK